MPDAAAMAHNRRMDLRSLVVSPRSNTIGRAGVLAGFTLLLLLAVWFAGQLAGRRAHAELAARANSGATQHAALLRSELEKHRSLPLVLVEDAEVREALAKGGSERLAALDRKLERLAAQTRTAVVYVLDPRGIAVAASNWRLPTSFVGADYSFRPYFREALRGRAPEHFALGAVSRHAGLFFARRVDGPDGPLGVVVVKVEFDELERDWRSSGEPVIVTDRRGIVLITSVPGWRFHALRPLDPAELTKLRAEGQFGQSRFDRLPISFHGSDADIRLHARDAPFVVAAVPASIRGWTLYLLSAASPAVDAAVLTARLGASCAAILLLICCWTLLRRRARAAIRAADQLRVQAELEMRVEQRTRELRVANQRLVLEMEERRRAELSRQELQDELAQANRLVTLGQIAAGVAHEINQPVAAIRTFADNAVLLLDRDDLASTRSNLGLIASLTEKIGVITSELRAFSRKTKRQAGPVQLEEAIDGALLLIGSRARAQGVALVRVGDTRGRRVLAELVRLEQVLVNLFQNALDALAGQSGGEIRIRTEARRGEMQISVIDNGPGIHPEVADALFKPFVTSKETGLGLGLVISRDLVAEFGGDLFLEQASAAGACFTIVLKTVA